MNNRNRKTDPNSSLYRAILTLRTPEECYQFFSDLCTVPEMNAMEQRFEVAQLLDQGLIYNKILEETGASSATISRVNRSLNYGNDGYRMVIGRMEEGK
ncbi:MAG: hypothetical protein HFG44_00720 [Oscillospiraceae bacterium]|jgi:TrpR-related protein YerC/YecD|nr:hypothetical protein [Oscillospiraceae bacterium]